ncbi:ubiquinol oxidase subunit II [Chromobacterium sp. IIBBL 290-4]|uniref:ubiquinol oxidase subunit II n=1 Tax=Chromobacterium sp. IIBBL 290-4 TaxID=2953890 RepID=UPI0020B7EBF0|nr:ubiquinol oxidase subunit II [Chromobacterium sp. IIBBL 290-4]UTH76588.1 ubiquinol oxidase subunit II [Chromobacterium sp. IIBBL 290-4]
MRNHRPSRLLWGLAPLVALLSGCQGGILDPKGPVAAGQKSLIITATALMLLVVIPVIVMTLMFAWKYRASNKDAAYEPKWSHSTKIELVVWLIPCVIIAFLATLTWKTTHELDPYRPLESAQKPIQVQVVALNWKWLFIYPEQQIASVNELAFPAGTPVSFKITSDAAMNSFFIPQLGGQIYAMAGMQTQLHLLANEPGTYKGFSSNYSGAGFSGMKFNAIATKTPEEFNAWVAKVKASSQKLDAGNYLQLLKPSEKNPVAYYSATTPYLFEAVLHKYMAGRPSLAESDDAIKLAKMTKELCAAITPPVVKE